MDNNIITDRQTVEDSITTFKVLDTFERLMRYMDTLEVQVGCYKEFVDDVEDKIKRHNQIVDISNTAFVEINHQMLDTLRTGLKDASDDNYGLLEKTDDTVKDVASAMCGPAFEEMMSKLYECVDCNKQMVIDSVDKSRVLIYKCTNPDCDGNYARKYWDEDDSRSVHMNEVRERLERL